MTDYLPHKFNPRVASVYGIPAALIFQFISYCCDSQKSKFVPLTIGTLAEQYPYLTRITVWNALQKLIHPGKRTPPLVIRKKLGADYVYGPIAPDEKFALHTFDVRVAVEHGVIPAIILHNVGHWVKQNWKLKAEEAFNKLNRFDYHHDFQAMWSDALVWTARAAAHTSSIEEWVDRHAYVSYRTAKRGFSCLQKAGLLVMRRGKRQKPIWTLSLKLRTEYAEKLLSLSGVENCEAKSERFEAKSERTEAKSERKSRLTSTAAKGSGAFDEASIDEATISEHGDGFASPLAGASVVARSASYAPSAASLSLRKEFDRLNRPSYKRTRKRPESGKRKYARKLQPGTEEFEVWFDDLSPAARMDYLSSRKGS